MPETSPPLGAFGHPLSGAGSRSPEVSHSCCSGYRNPAGVVPATSPLLQQRAASERLCIEDVSVNHARCYAVVGLQPVEPVGAERLAALTQASGVTV